MKFFIALSFDHREELAPVIAEIKGVLERHGHTYEVFVEKQLEENISPSHLMKLAIDTLKECDALIAEISHKMVGVGIEIGIAHQLGIPIIGIRKEGSEPSTTIEGVINALYEYKDPKEINQFLPEELKQLKKKETGEETNKEIEGGDKSQIDLLIECANSEAAYLIKKYHLDQEPQTKQEKQLMKLRLAYELLLKYSLSEEDRLRRQILSDGKITDQELSTLEKLRTDHLQAGSRLLEQREQLIKKFEETENPLRWREIETKAVEAVWKPPLQPQTIEGNRPSPEIK